MSWNLGKAGMAVAAIVVCVGAQAASSGVSAIITAEKQNLGKADDVFIKVTLTNTTSTPQYVLKWHTPFDTEIEDSLFEVTRDGVKVTYLGPHYKRPAPTAADYFLLQPGKSYTVRVELSSMYEMNITGDYTVRYKADAIESAPVTLWIDGARPRGSQTQEQLTLKQMQEATPAAAGLAFNRCTASQQSTIASAVSAGSSMASDGDAYMAKGSLGARYTKWFGAVDTNRAATVKAHFVALKDAFASKPITVDCGCKKTYYAYVYPTQPYTIYVCKAFWSAPMTGTDSKGGTLVHEMSHFNVVAGTDDWVYGQSGAASLAISDPSKAIDNADSHEYFGENTPALP
jgi:peptidyl-Lys metalloendopeptidase